MEPIFGHALAGGSTGSSTLQCSTVTSTVTKTSLLPITSSVAGNHTPSRSYAATRLRQFNVRKSAGKCAYAMSLSSLVFLQLWLVLYRLLWRSISRNDISGGFSLARYILGVGVFVVGCEVAIHSKTCTCWSSSSRMVLRSQGSFLELEAIDNNRNVHLYELPS